MSLFICAEDEDNEEQSNSWCCRPNAPAYKDKRCTHRAWDAEWGRIGKEGNIWWVDASLGDPRAQQISGRRRQWEVMGVAAAHCQKGLNYRPNSRFDANGRGRRRKEWLAKLG
jgi:palmitoyltransferase